MTTKFTANQLSNFLELRESRRDSAQFDLFPGILTHVYVHLDLHPRYAIPETKADATSYLKAVAKTAVISEAVAAAFGGMVLEVQGVVIHVGVPGGLDHDRIVQITQAIHTAMLIGVEPVYKAVSGWRMTADTGQTLVVPGAGAHGDLSFVSLGNAANRPAKHLYAQMAIENEANRKLKRFHLGYRNPNNGQWVHTLLSAVETRANENDSFNIKTAAARQDFEIKSVSQGFTEVQAMAVPIGTPGSPSSPTSDEPNAHCGWVMRADLDGFTERVRDCFDHPAELIKLAIEFRILMEAARYFTKNHREIMYQLPWTGDNFTAAVIFEDKAAYDKARPERLIEHALDFDRETKDDAPESTLGGWAYGIGGGDVRSTVSNNVFIGSVEFDQRRFLVGAGEGFTRSLGAFADIKPPADHMVVYSDDYYVLEPKYKMSFAKAQKVDGATSALFWIGKLVQLKKDRLKSQTANRAVEILTAAGSSSAVPTKPYAHE